MSKEPSASVPGMKAFFVEYLAGRWWVSLICDCGLSVNGRPWCETRHVGRYRSRAAALREVEYLGRRLLKQEAKLTP